MIDLRGVTSVLKMLWTDKATIKAATTGTPTVDDPFNNSISVTLCENEPCKVSPSPSLKSDGDKGYYNASAYDAMLIIRNGIDIPSGAEITITDVNGKQTTYKRSSKGYTGYQSHQEVAMTLEDKA